MRPTCPRTSTWQATSFSITDLSHLPSTGGLINLVKLGHRITSRKHVNAWWEDISSHPTWKVFSLRQQYTQASVVIADAQG